MSRRVVITGMGAVTPIGNNVTDFWSGLKENKVGIAPVTKFDVSEYKVNVGAEVKDFDALDYFDKKEAKRLDLFSQYAIVSAREAMQQANISVTEENAERIGCVIGTGVGGISTQEQQTRVLIEKGPKRVSPLMVPMFICNMAAGNVCIDLGIRGKSMSISTACATGTNCIGEAFRTIQYGEADVMVAGGVEAPFAPSGVVGFCSLNALSTEVDPLKASRPFDENRSGFVMGEGCGVVVLEELEHALNRGAHILAEIVGYGSTSDAFHITLPREDGSGASKAMVAAMKDAGISSDQIDYINAHGTSTHANDLYETRAIKLALGEHAYEVPINSTKSMIGHLLGAAGAVEFIVCVKSIEDGYVHATVGLENPDAECDLDYVPSEGRTCDITYAMSNSLGFGGHNACLIVKKYVE